MLPASESSHASLDTIVTLPHATGISRIADECRQAALAFVNGARAWNKSDLARWLSGPYSRATSHVAHVPRVPVDHEPIELIGSTIDPELLARILAHTYETVVETLRAAANPEYADAITRMAVSNDLVVQCEDEHGTQGWAAVSRPRVVLADRVISLVVADFLTRPHDYESSLAICGRCGAAVFDPIARAMGLCSAHRSGIVLRRALTTMPAPPEEGA
jgi:hypothetical protein